MGILLNVGEQCHVLVAYGAYRHVWCLSAFEKSKSRLLAVGNLQTRTRWTLGKALKQQVLKVAIFSTEKNLLD